MQLHLPRNIRYLRKINKITQNELGEHLGKKHTVVGGYENEKIVPPVNVLIEISEFFKVGVEDLLFKNMELEEYEVVEEPPMDYEEMKDKLIELLEEKVARYEAVIKRDAPDVARGLGLE